MWLIILCFYACLASSTEVLCIVNMSICLFYRNEFKTQTISHLMLESDQDTSDTDIPGNVFSIANVNCNSPKRQPRNWVIHQTQLTG